MIKKMFLGIKEINQFSKIQEKKSITTKTAK